MTPRSSRPQRPRSSRAALAVALLGGLVIGLAISNGRLVGDVDAADNQDYQELETFTNVLAIVKKNYVEEVTTKQLVDGAIDGMLAALDPHSAYLTPELYRELQVETKGAFGGLGIEITQRNGMLTVVAPIEDTPAYRAGLKSGDVILKINGEFTKDMSLVEAVKKLRGKKDTTVHLTIKREGSEKLREVTLTREVIKIRSVKSKVLEPGYGYLRITQFQERTDEDLTRALRKLTEKPGMRGLVLDLRNNPGGLLSQAVQVADIFLDGGLIVYTDGRLENQKQKYFAHKAGTFDAFPMIVLVNSGSASASEIVAGALQDQKRGLVVGQATFGKGSVQTILPLNEDAALRLTTARYYTPSGRSIQAKGIEPDIAVEQTKDGKSRFPVIREADLRGHLENQDGQGTTPSEDEDAGFDVTEDEDAANIHEGELGADPQLDYALDLLKHWQQFKAAAAASPPSAG